FMWGVADHQSREAQVYFIENHIEFFPKQYPGLLVFRCGEESSNLLIGYNPMTGEIIEGQKALDTVISNPTSKLFHSGVFSHYSASAVAGLGILYNVSDEIKAFKTGGQTLSRLFIGLGVIIPTSYIGYMASGLFNIECGSRKIYDQLRSEKIWN